MGKSGKSVQQRKGVWQGMALQGGAVKLAVAFAAVSAMALVAGVALYFEPHLAPGVKAEDLLQVNQPQLGATTRLSDCRWVKVGSPLATKMGCPSTAHAAAVSKLEASSSVTSAASSGTSAQSAASSGTSTKAKVSSASAAMVVASSSSSATAKLTAPSKPVTAKLDAPKVPSPVGAHGGGARAAYHHRLDPQDFQLRSGESDIGGEHGYGDQGVYQMDAMMKAEHLVPTPLSATVPWSVSNSQRNTATAQQFLQQSV